jgi:hypothetical protein
MLYCIHIGNINSKGNNMIDLIAEFVEIDLHNQKILKDRSKYMRVYITHEDGSRSLIAKHIKQNDLKDFPMELIGEK